MHSHPLQQARTQWSIRLPLMLALGLVTVLLLVVLAIASLSIVHIYTITHQAIDVDARLSKLANDVAANALLCRRYETGAFLRINDPSAHQYHMNMWKVTYQNLQFSIAAFGRAATSPEDKRQVINWQAQSAHYESAFLGVENAITTGRIETIELASAAFKPHENSIDQLTTTALATAYRKAEAAQRSGVTLQDITTSRASLMGIVGMCALGIALGWIWFFPRRLTKPIATLYTATHRLAEGDLSSRATIARNDEIGQLAHNFNHMATVIQQKTNEREAQHAAAEHARAQAEAAHAQITAQLRTIEQQQSIIREMHVPVLRLSPTTLMMPLVGALDTARLALVLERALHALERSAARWMILDITGVPIVDTQVAQGLIQIVQATRLLGTEVVVVGVRPEVAQAIVGLGLNLSSITTQSTLESGIAYVLERQATRAASANLL